MKNNNLNILYKVTYNGVTHYLLGSLHTAMTDMVLANRFSNIADEVPLELLKKRKVKKIYFECNPSEMESVIEGAMLSTGLEYAVYNKAKAFKEKKEITFHAIESNVAPELVETRFEVFTFRVIVSSLLIIAAVCLSSFSIWMYAMAFLPVILELSVSRIKAKWFFDGIERFNCEIVKCFKNDCSLKRDYFVDAESLHMNSRNEEFSRVILAEKEPSLFVYGIMHNMSHKKMKGVLDRLNDSNAEIYGYETLSEFTTEISCN